MSFQLIQKLRFIFDGYFLIFVTGINAYGLYIDTNQSRDKGSMRDLKLSKRIYISIMTISIALFVITKFL